MSGTRALQNHADLLAAKLQPVLASLKRYRAQLRVAMLVLAFAIFVSGAALSIDRLALKPSDLVLAPLMLLSLGIVPVAIAYSSINMMLMGKAVGAPIGFVEGMRISVFAQVAELLPIPGGAIVRTAALMNRGAGTLRSTGVVLAFALLWVSVAAVGGGLALLNTGIAGQTLLVAGLVGSIGICAWLANRFGWRIALPALGLRLFGIALVSVRTVLAFAAIGLALGWSDSLAFVFGIILGSAASIVPAGLGIGEGISALLAVPLAVAPEAAFLAVGLARLVGFAGNVIGVAIFAWLIPAQEGEADHG
ncbi:flippase-like domain-containing protein [Qipengyuania sp. GH1]|uniref:flippase-like domain-containing protein n=1 Tax=Qipengyuania aestuarii TaxID=2867241 RepID=UPI001C88304F|nr:flippase-like domain-containing protein [Qipengyuania aestuarii]MBX7536185.1 flippase-like domain-containing protein [Qipengyuania aestuarii]